MSNNLVVLLLLAFPLSASAGCYTESNIQCSTQTIVCNSDDAKNYVTFGLPITALCYDVSAWKGEAEKQYASAVAWHKKAVDCNDAAKQATDLAAQLVTQCAATKVNYDSCLTYANASYNKVVQYQSLEKRLRSACGSKCKKIKF